MYLKPAPVLQAGEILHDKIKSLRVELDGGVNLNARVWLARLHPGLRCVPHRGRCYGRVPEILAGHCTLRLDEPMCS